MTVPDGLLDHSFAHRGLWSPDGDRPENSLAAFDAACAAGYGIELDVRLSADGAAVVFHDDALERMTGEAGPVDGRDLAQLAILPLAGTDQRIPTLAAVLDLIGDRAPVLIELKTSPGRDGILEAQIAALTNVRTGRYAYIGFDPRALARLAQLDPHRPRGLSAQELSALDNRGLVQPQFLVVRLDLIGDEQTRRLRADGLPVIAWTVKTEADCAAAAPDCDSYIFEGLRP